jgi:hypothetical protein
MDSKYDEEKQYVSETYTEAVPSPPPSAGEVIVTNRPKVFQKLNHFLSRIGGEERGIERVLPHERSNQVSPFLIDLTQ